MGSTLRKFFSGSKDVRILLIGIDNAGKTTILYRMKLGEVVTTIPSIGFNVETIKWKNIFFTAWDVGGRDKARPLIRHYLQNTQAIVCVVDSNDHERMDEVREFLRSLTFEDEIRDSLILVLANKQDLPNAKSPLAISEALQLHTIRQHWHIIPTVGTTGEGLFEGLEWIAEMLNRRHLPKDSEAVLQVKQRNFQSNSDNYAGYFAKTWHYFKSFFIDDKDSPSAPK